MPELIEAKRSAEHGLFPDALRAAVEADVPRLQAELEAARVASHLPDKPSAEAVEALHELVVSERLNHRS